MGRGLRPRRIPRRPAVVLALAIAGALAATGIALASASSSVSGFLFAPNNPHGQFTSGRLHFGTNTNYTAATSTSRIQIHLDDDFQFNPDSFPKCNPADISGNITMQEALQACGPAAGAANNAWLWHPSAVNSNGKAAYQLGIESPTACVLVFNGSGSASEVLLFIRVKVDQHDGPIDCGGPPTNTDGDTTSLVRGDLKANPAAVGGDFTDPDNCSAPGPRQGCQIDLPNVSTGPMRLTRLDVRIFRSNYVRARCVDPPAGNRQWNLRAMFTYANPAATQTVNRSQTCT